MMGPSNPYGPSGPPPPGLSSQHALNVPPGGMCSNPMYPPNPGMPHGLPPHPSQQQGGMPPKHPGTRNMSNIQLQQLSAQMKAYRLLSRNMNPPEALMSIVHGRKPTQAMLAALNSGRGGQPGSSGGGGGGPAGGQSPSPNPSPGPGGSGGGGGNINLYPPSPNISQSQGASPNTPQPQGTSLMRSTSATSINSISAAPNVTISSSGELPLPVRQAMSAAQQAQNASSGSVVGTAPSQPLTVMAPAKGVASSLPTSSAAPSSSGKVATQVKQVKLGPPGKPLGIDPLVIIKEREHR